MQAKSVMYAAVGAPVVAVRKVGDRVSTLRGRLNKETTNYTKRAEEAIAVWAAEGEKLVSKISEGKVVEEITAKVDLDQAKVQVTKLRDQLEDMLATWRTSFRPATEPATETPKSEPAKPKTTTGSKKPAAKTSAAKTTKSSTAAKTSSAKTTTADAAKAS